MKAKLRLTDLQKVVSLGFITFLCTSYTSVYPYSYLPEMIKWMNYKEYQKGSYAGAVASSYYVGSTIFSYFWGWISDKYGRKSVLVLSTSISAISCLLFGFCNNIYIAIFIRFVDGAANSITAVVNALIYDFSDDRTQSIAASICSLGWGLGFSLGPLISGYLATPVGKNMYTFERTNILERYPYFLPNLFSFILTLICAVLLHLFLPNNSVRIPYHKLPSEIEMNTPNDTVTREYHNVLDSRSETNSDTLFDRSLYETLTKSRYSDLYEKNRYNLSSTVKVSEKRTLLLNDKCRFKCQSNILTSIRNSTLFALLKRPRIIQIVIANGLFYFAVGGFWEIIPITLSTSRSYGGLEFSTSDIGLVMGVTSFVGLFLQVLFVHKLEQKFGAIQTFVIFSILSSSFISITALIRLISNQPLLWFLLYGGTFFIITTIVAALTLITVVTNNCSKNHTVGAVNGIAQTIASLSRALAPVIGGNIFEASITSAFGPPIDASTVFVFYGFTLFCCVIVVFFCPRNFNRQSK